MLNHIIVMGRLTRDPELRKTNNDKAVCNFTVAVERDRAVGDEKTDFIDCVAWQSTGEFIKKYFRKGQMAVVSGKLQLRTYNDKEGHSRKAAEINVSDVYFGEPKRETADEPIRAETPERAPARPRFTELPPDDGDLPF